MLGVPQSLRAQVSDAAGMEQTLISSHASAAVFPTNVGFCTGLVV